MDELGENLSGLNFSIDPNHELFLHHGDSTGMKLVTKVLEGDNYDHWSRFMTISLIAKNKIGFVNGTCKRPMNNPPLESQWDRCNNMVISWIIHSVVPDIAESVIYCQEAQEIWKELYQRFGKSNSVKLYQVHKELIMVEQGDLSISPYFTKFKKLKDQYSAIFCIPTCDCGSSQAISEVLETQHTLQFLMGLNSDYNTVRGNILMIQPLPNVSRVYNLLIQEEKQREIGNPSVQTNISAFQSSTGRGGFRFKGNDAAPRRFQNIFQNSQKGQNINGNNNSARRNLYCTNCHMNGHNVENCFKLHGYPSTFRSKGRKVWANTVQDENHNPNRTTTTSNPVFEGSSHTITVEQYNTLVDLLSQHGMSVPVNDDGTSASQVLASTAIAGMDMIMALFISLYMMLRSLVSQVINKVKLPHTCSSASSNSMDETMDTIVTRTPSPPRPFTEADVMFNALQRFGVDKDDLLDALLNRLGELEEKVEKVDALEAELISANKALNEALMREQELLAYIGHQQVAKHRKNKCWRW